MWYGTVVRQCSIDPEITGSDPAVTSPQEKEVQKILFCRIFAKILFLQKTFFSIYAPLISETVKLMSFLSNFYLPVANNDS